VGETKQRRKVLKTKCKVQGKCCNLVIDGHGGTKNLVSTKIMDNLKLKSLVHPNPYKFSWLQKGQHVTMNKQCLLNFQIGSLQEHVFCDMVEMDACHILLGRTWLFAKQFYHDIQENTCYYRNDGQR